MLFTSYRFLGFLAVLLLAYYLTPLRHQWKLLLAASCLFYCAAGPGCLLYILATALTVYYAAVRVEDNKSRQDAYLKARKAELSREEKQVYRGRQKAVRRRWVAGCLILNFGILAAVKYAGFLTANINGVLAALGQAQRLSFFQLAMPMGISFYTLQAAGYLIDVYRGSVPAERDPFRFVLFVSFFPQLIQGPISRFGDLSPSLYGGRSFSPKQVAYGLERMLWGYFKKLVVADRIVTAVSAMTGDSAAYQGAYALPILLFYTVELYADFTGGIDITIGIAQALGIEVRENFLRPYFSKSLKEYWRRWHITMCSWFRDYVFYPVSTSRPMQRFTKFARGRLGEKAGRRLPVYLSSFVVWLATGVWHGANWNFIVWGLCNWAVLMLSEELEPLYGRFHARFPGLASSLPYRLFQVGRTFALVCVLNLFDCYRTLGETVRVFASLFTARNWSVLWDGSLLKLGLAVPDYAVLAAGVLVMLGVSLLQSSGSIRDRIAAKPYPARFALWLGLFLAVLLLGAYGVGYDASQFIYNQF